MNPTPFMNTMAFEAAFAAMKAKHPNNPELFEGENLAQFKASFIEGGKKENERITAIADYAKQYQLQGASLKLAEMMMFEEGGHTVAHLQAALGPIHRGGASVSSEDVATAAGKMYDAVPALRQEHPTRAGYVEMKRAEAEGRVRISRAVVGRYRYAPTSTGGV